MKKLILTGALRYNLEGKLYIAKGDDGKTQVIYEVDDKLAEYLLAQYDFSTGYNFFEAYHGDAKGVAPGTALEDEREIRAAKGAKPKQNERHLARERKARGPRPATASQAKPGSVSADIEDADVGVEV